MRNYHLFKNFAATADAAASVQFAQSGTIKNIVLVTSGDLDADGEGYVVEVSFVPTFQAATNDAQGILAIASETNTSTATAVSGTSISIPCNASVKAGDKLYLNAILVGTGDIDVFAIVSVQ